jgi:hypothetical protein
MPHSFEGSDHTRPTENPAFRDQPVVNLGGVVPEAPEYTSPLRAVNAPIPPPVGRRAPGAEQVQTRESDKVSPPASTDQTGNSTEVPQAPQEAPRSRSDTPHIPARMKSCIGTLVSTETMAMRHPEWPNVKLHIHLAPHTRPSDAAKVPKLLQKADVYVYESSYGPVDTPTFEAAAQADLGDNPQAAVEKIVSTSKTPKGKPLKGTFDEPILRALAGSGIPIGHYDTLLPKYPGTNDSILKHELSQQFAHGETLEETVNWFVNSIIRSNRISDTRDAVALGPVMGDDGTVTAGRFEQEVERLLADNPQLRKQPGEEKEITILETRGHAHLDMLHRGRAAGVTVERSFPETPYVFPYWQQLSRELSVGKQPSREVLIRAYTSQVLHCLNLPLGIPNYDQSTIQYSRQICDKLDEADARAIHTFMITNSGNIKADKLAGCINERLTNKGHAPLLTSAEDIKAWQTDRQEAYAKKVMAVKADMVRRQTAQTD